MMIKIKNLILFPCLLLSTFQIEAKNESSLLMGPSLEATPKIIVNNKILAKAHGTVISTVDVMKKMDMLFYRQFPDYISSPEARFQFYQANWKHVLQEFIDKELILADAAESKIEVSSGDIRQEMESYFGPNIIDNLDKVGLSFDEASKMIQDEITIRRMLMYRANAKALRMVTPSLVHQAYNTYAADPKNALPPRWSYQVISIRGPQDDTNKALAQEAYRLLNEQNVKPADLPEELKKAGFIDSKTKVTVSEVFTHEEQEMSQEYRTAVLGLGLKRFSNPMAQKSRADKSIVYRIFYLKDKDNGGVLPFKQMESKLKEKLLSEAADKEKKAYISRLQKHYHVQDSNLKTMVTADYQPFVLK